MNIVFVLEHFYPYIGGVEKLFYSLSKELVKQGHTVTVITTRFDKSLNSNEKINEVNVIRLNLRNRYLFTFFGVFFMLKYIKKSDIVHTTTYNAALPAVLSGWLTGKKVIVTFHEYWGKLWFSLPYLSFIERIMFSFYEQIILRLPYKHIVGVSEYTVGRLKEKLPNKKNIQLIYNGLEYTVEQWKPKTRISDFSFCYYGRLGVSKGLDILLEACVILKQRKVSFDCKIIIPKIPQKIYFSVLNSILKKDIADVISLYHNLSFENLREELLISDCVVIPSYTEGFCFSAAEAVAMGIPVIASKNGALPEVVSGKHIFFEKNQPSFLADAIIKAKNNDWDFCNVKKFELDSQISQYLELYNKYSK
ncbi:MAG: glycosyltransferase family 4 protein [Bacteroidales bacterium]|nr:glycosyltransferase family 4 protein [Bacteroidales bacterium]